MRQRKLVLPILLSIALAGGLSVSTGGGVALAAPAAAATDDVNPNDTPNSPEVLAARRDTSWLKDGKYGVMLQYGAWGYPNSVAERKSLDQQAEDFNVPSFVESIKKTGASYVVWSITWGDYTMESTIKAPDAAVKAAVGQVPMPSLTSKRDLVGEIAKALHKQGIRVLLYYYHSAGHQTRSPQWMTATGGDGGSIDKDLYLSTYKNVLTDIGKHFGKNLDGIMIEQGNALVGADFEELEKVARTGNPNRLVSYLPGQAASVTNFQDVWFGESRSADAIPDEGRSATNSDGIFTGGNQQGLYAVPVFRLDNTASGNDWGLIHNYTVPPIVPMAKDSISGIDLSVAGLSHQLSSASRQGAAAIFNVDMYEDGTMADTTLSKLSDVRWIVRDTGDPLSTTMQYPVVDDNSASIKYTGQWSSSGGGTVPTFHKTTTAGDTATLTFDGVAIDVIGTSQPGTELQITVDGNSFEMTTQNGGSPLGGGQPSALLYGARNLAPGLHTLSVKYLSGPAIQLDSFRNVPNPDILTNDDPAFSYSGDWTKAAGQPGDVSAQLAVSKTKGDSLTIPFKGTGVDVLGPMTSSDGTADVYLDGKKISTITATMDTVDTRRLSNYAAVDSSCTASYCPKQHYWGIRNLAAGQHKLRIVNTTSSPSEQLRIDAISVVGSPTGPRTTAFTVDDADPAVQYTGSFSSYDPGGCYDATCHNAHSTGSTATLAFNGTGIAWRSIVGSDQGSASVSIDGGAPTTVTLTRTARALDVEVYTSPVLAAGPHTIKITTLDNRYVTVDRFIVNL